MFKAPESPYLVPFDGSFDLAAASTTPLTDAPRHKGDYRRESRDNLNKLQRVLAAGDRHAVLLVFQAMDAAGKDSTIRAVMQGVDPSGCQVFSFKKPSSLELDHDFLWRTTCRLPERGRIGIFNRSQYEEVLVVRVHPEILGYQKLPGEVNLDTIWEERLTSIRQQEEHLARNGTVILKFWLNVSKDEQKAALPVAARRAGKELEVRTERRRRAASLGRVHGRLRGGVERNLAALGTVVRDPGRQQVLHARAGLGHHHRDAAIHRPALPGALRGRPGGICSGARGARSRRVNCVTLSHSVM